jgi:hypothetical protein
MRGAHQKKEGNTRKERRIMRWWLAKQTKKGLCMNWNSTKRQNKPLNEPSQIGAS